MWSSPACKSLVCWLINAALVLYSHDNVYVAVVVHVTSCHCQSSVGSADECLPWHERRSAGHRRLNLNLRACNWDLKHESPTVAREDVLQPIQFLLQYWPSRLFKVNDFYFIWNRLCHFLLPINSNLGSAFYRFRDTATYSLEISIEHCGQTVQIT